jgi:hypothetical protein
VNEETSKRARLISVIKGGGSVAVKAAFFKFVCWVIDLV